MRNGSIIEHKIGNNGKACENARYDKHSKIQHKTVNGKKKVEKSVQNKDIVNESYNCN